MKEIRIYLKGEEVKIIKNADGILYKEESGTLEVATCGHWESFQKGTFDWFCIL